MYFTSSYVGFSTAGARVSVRDLYGSMYFDTGEATSSDVREEIPGYIETQCHTVTITQYFSILL